ncbi:hypothetical protein [Apibacter adventoris]|nr:hypothetical protein [Apibacter adventoris]
MEKNFIYGIDFNIATPFEILVNDAPVIKYNEEGSMSGFYPINELLINNKDQEISVRLYSEIGKEFIAEDISKYFSLKLVLSKDVNFEHFKEIQNIKIPEIIKNTPYIEYKYHFNIEVPYQLEGWINSVDLTKENKEALLKEVKMYYQKIYGILNKGDYSHYSKIISKRNHEVLVAYYDSEIIKKEQDELLERITTAQGKMKPIDFNKYNLKIYGNGRLVTLEDEKGDSPLFCITEEYEDYFGIILYRPALGAPLEVIR